MPTNSASTVSLIRHSVDIQPRVDSNGPETQGESSAAGSSAVQRQDSCGELLGSTLVFFLFHQRVLCDRNPWFFNRRSSRDHHVILYIRPEERPAPLISAGVHHVITMWSFTLFRSLDPELRVVGRLGPARRSSVLLQARDSWRRGHQERRRSTGRSGYVM